MNFFGPTDKKKHGKTHGLFFHAFFGKQFLQLLQGSAATPDPKLGPPDGPKNGAAVSYLTAKPSRTAAPKMGPAL